MVSDTIILPFSSKSIALSLLTREITKKKQEESFDVILEKLRISRGDEISGDVIEKVSALFQEKKQLCQPMIELGNLTARYVHLLRNGDAFPDDWSNNINSIAAYSVTMKVKFYYDVRKISWDEHYRQNAQGLLDEYLHLMTDIEKKALEYSSKKEYYQLEANAVFGLIEFDCENARYFTDTLFRDVKHDFTIRDADQLQWQEGVFTYLNTACQPEYRIFPRMPSSAKFFHDGIQQLCSRFMNAIDSLDAAYDYAEPHPNFRHRKPDYTRNMPFYAIQRGVITAAMDDGYDPKEILSVFYDQRSQAECLLLVPDEFCETEKEMSALANHFHKMANFTYVSGYRTFVDSSVSPKDVVDVVGQHIARTQKFGCFSLTEELSEKPKIFVSLEGAFSYIPCGCYYMEENFDKLTEYLKTIYTEGKMYQEVMDGLQYAENIAEDYFEDCFDNLV